MIMALVFPAILWAGFPAGPTDGQAFWNGGVLYIYDAGNAVWQKSASPVAIENGGTGATLADPGADKIFFWDDSEGSASFLSVGSGLSLSGTTLTATGGGSPSQNLITNSGLGVCSQSTREVNPDHAADLASNGGFDSSTTGWTVLGGATLASVSGGQSGNCLEVTVTGGTSQGAVQSISVEAGKLYRYTVYVKSGTAGDQPFMLNAYDGGGSTFNEQITGTSTSSWTQYTIVFVPTVTNPTISLKKYSATAGTILFDTASVHEVVPAFLSANDFAPDGWSKSPNIDIYRLFKTDLSVANSSLYGVKLVAASGGVVLQWPRNYDNIQHVSKFAGKTISFGAYVTSSYADDARIYIYDVSGSSTTTYSSYHTGSGTREWLEASRTVPSNCTALAVAIVINTSGHSAYFSDPVMVTGNAIGEGNYMPIGQEIIFLDSGITGNSDGNSFSDVASGKWFWEAEYNGKIPKNARAVYAAMTARDSSSYSSDSFIIFYNGASGTQPAGYVNTSGLVNDTRNRVTGILTTYSYNDTIVTDYSIEASGSSTLDLTVRPYAVQLR